MNANQRRKKYRSLIRKYFRQVAAFRVERRLLGDTSLSKMTDEQVAVQLSKHNP